MQCPNCQAFLEDCFFTREYDKTSIYFKECEKCKKYWYLVLNKAGKEWYELIYSTIDTNNVIDTIKDK